MRDDQSPDVSTGDQVDVNDSILRHLVHDLGVSLLSCVSP